MRLAAETSSGFKGEKGVESGDSARASDRSEGSEPSRVTEEAEEAEEVKVEGPSTPSPGSGSATLVVDEGESGGVLSHAGKVYGSTRLGRIFRAASSPKLGHTQL